ncbi:putative cell wall protein [Rhypophila decipiens]|uniref:chitinase n=1 Tax=Rhypophila decipiens TaxID=261697 RepID=A0AAN7BCD8_9PEZI|nr:putative cell wall protein [Rhypophila decipiens]
MVSPTRYRAALAAGIALLSSAASAQTWTHCDPTKTSCEPNTALGMTIDVDFSQGEVNSFVASGGTPSYGSDGVSFTVAGSGQAPQLTSVFYIMFGRVEVTMKAAPGAGIVSSLVLQSDCLDEIDMEWIGPDSNQVQTNYFGKGQTGSYNRGQFNPAPNNQAEWVKYTIDWTPERIIWSVGETVVRTTTTSEAGSQYPQTPMQVKFGAWAGGDPSMNAPGTVEWAGGPTDFSKGPFSMHVKSAVVSDYSTGKQYVYGDMSGTWQSIKSEGGEINGNKGNVNTLTLTATAPAPTSNSPTIPAGGIGPGGTRTQTGYPWVPTGTDAPPQSTIPDGWVMTPSGKIVPAGSSSINLPIPTSSSGSSQQSPGGGVSNNGDGFTTITSAAGSPTAVPQAPASDNVAGSALRAPSMLLAFTSLLLGYVLL